MFSISSIYSRLLRQGRVQKKVRQPVAIALERLESRDVPTTWLWDAKVRRTGKELPTPG